MVRVVVRLSPLAKVGVTVVLAGAGLAIYAAKTDADWAVGTSRVVIAVGMVLYFAARFRAFRKSRKP